MNTVMTVPATNAAMPAIDARVAGRRGLNPTLLRIELLRVLRNKRTMIFTLIMPIGLYFLFGAGQKYSGQGAGNGNVAGDILTSMALYGAMTATAVGGAIVASERALGWSRQLRVTPLSGTAYIATKAIVALTVAAIPVLVMLPIGVATGARVGSPVDWVAMMLLTWLGSSVFAAFGLAMGYLIPSENAMQFTGPLMAVMAMCGGIFVSDDGTGFFHTFSMWTPMWGVGRIAHMPQLGWSSYGWQAPLSMVAWLAIFTGVAVWGFRRDTARV